MNWFALYKSAMPLMEETPPYAKSYYDIGHANLPFFADRYKGRKPDAVQLWGVDKDWKFHSHPEYHDDWGRMNHDSLANLVGYGDEFMAYGRFEKNEQEPNGIVSITYGASFHRLNPGELRRRAAMQRIEQMIDQKFGNPRIVNFGR